VGGPADDDDDYVHHMNYYCDYDHWEGDLSHILEGEQDWDRGRRWTGDGNGRKG
jgi:hypothetical protein